MDLKGGVFGKMKSINRKFLIHMLMINISIII